MRVYAELQERINGKWRTIPSSGNLYVADTLDEVVTLAMDYASRIETNNPNPMRPHVPE